VSSYGTRTGTAGAGHIADLVTATVLQDKGVGHISQEHAVVGGIMPNSVYYCKTERLDELEPVLVRFVTALGRSMTDIADESPESLTELVTGLWPDVPTAALQSATGRLLASRTWETTSVDPAACNRWTGILQDAGLVTAAPAFEALVSTRITDAARVPA
jgi:NitT/TauT family transport system substrate-binding protein